VFQTRKFRYSLAVGALAIGALAPATAAFALPIGGGDPPPPPPTTRPPTTTTPPPTTPTPPTGGLGSPRYKLEAISFHVDDESGWDWLGSDEPVWVFHSKDGAGAQKVASQAFSDADSGDTFYFTTGKCLVVNCTTGVSGPLGLTTQLVESDGGSEADIRANVHYGILALHWAAKIFGVDTSSFDQTIEDYFVSLFSDDLMGSANLVWQNWELQQALPTVGSSYTESIHLGEQGGDLPSWIDNPPDYTLKLRITRMPDAPPVLAQATF
jgi:hypothetical protein